jgi:hypothetical protein
MGGSVLSGIGGAVGPEYAILPLTPTGLSRPEILKADCIATYLSLGPMINTSQFIIHEGRLMLLALIEWCFKGLQTIF